MFNEARAGAQNNRERKPPVGKHAWEKMAAERMAAGWQGAAARGEVRPLPEKKARTEELAAISETKKGPYRERTLTLPEQLEKKLEQLKAKVHNNEIHADLKAAEQLFEDLKQTHSEEEVAAYDQKLKITEGLEAARHLANLYDQLEVWKADQGSKEAHPLYNEEDPTNLRQKAEANLKESREFSKKYEAALKHLDEIYHGRNNEKDEEAQETKGLEGDDLTLPYEKRLGFLETKIRERLKTTTGREPTQEEFDQVVYKVNGTPSPLSKRERAGQFLKRLGESTLGKVFDTFADTSIQEAVSQYRALENEGLKASETVQTLMAEKARREAYAQHLQEQVKNLEKIRTDREERVAREEALGKMKSVPLDNGAALKHQKALEQKRRILARNQFKIEKQHEKKQLEAEIVEAIKKEDKEALERLKTRRDHTADDFEREIADAELFNKNGLDRLVEKRLNEWYDKELAAFKASKKGAKDPNSREEDGETRKEKARQKIIKGIKKTHEKILARKGGVEDLFFKEKDALKLKKKKTGEQGKTKEEPDTKEVEDDLNPDEWRLGKAAIQPPEEPITLGQPIKKNETNKVYTLGEKHHLKNEKPFTIGEEEAVIPLVRARTQQEEAAITLTRIKETVAETQATSTADNFSLKPELAIIHQKASLQKEKGRQEKERAERKERQERKRENEIISQLLKEFKDAANWQEEDILASAKEILRGMHQLKFTNQEIKDSLLEFGGAQSSSWKEQVEKQTGRVQKGARNKLLMIEILDELLQEGSQDLQPQKDGRIEIPAIPTTAEATAAASRAHDSPEPDQPQILESTNEGITDEEIEVFLENSLLEEGLSIESLTNQISKKIQNTQEKSPKEWKDTETLLRASILFKGEVPAKLTSEEITKKYLDFLCLYRLAKMQGKEADVKLIQKQVINSISPKIGVPTGHIDRWIKQPVPMELVPESIAKKLSTYRKKSAQTATS